MKLDHFKSKEHVDGIKEKRFSKSRIRWEGPDSYTVNKKAKKLKYMFKDPSNIPHYDPEAGAWDLGDNFELAPAEQKKDFQHPFMKDFI